MKPPNSRRPILLPDGEPVRCMFMAHADAPLFWERCEQDATNTLSDAEMVKFLAWLLENSRAIIRLYPGRPAYLCDRHGEIIRECQFSE